MGFLERDHRIATRPDAFYFTPHYKDYPSVLVRIARLSDAQLRELLASGHEFMVLAARGTKLPRKTARK
jgi:hypothetical protein